MALFRFGNDPRAFIPVTRTTFQNARITEQEIQRALAKDISPLLPDVLVICDERGFWVDANRRVDLLCLDRFANLVVVELKRDETAAQADLQALRYAAMVSAMSFKHLCEIHAQYLSEIEGGPVNVDRAAQVIRSFLLWKEGADESEFNENVHIVLAASDFSKELTTAALWLNQKGINIECFRIVPYQMGDEVVVDFHRVIPVPESEEFRIQLREKEEEKAAARRSERDYTRYRFNGSEDFLPKRKLALAVLSTWVADNAPNTVEELHAAFPNAAGACGGALAVTLSEALRVEQTLAGRRHFLEEHEQIAIGGHRYCVTNQWGLRNITPLIEEAIRCGYTIDAR